MKLKILKTNAKGKQPVLQKLVKNPIIWGTNKFLLAVYLVTVFIVFMTKGNAINNPIQNWKWIWMGLEKKTFNNSYSIWRLDLSA